MKISVSATMIACCAVPALALAAALLSSPDPSDADAVGIDSTTIVVDTLTLGRDGLTEADYAEAAQELGVDIATIHAVIDVEAGTLHQGFYDGEHPLVCFSQSLFEKYARKRGTNLSRYRKSHPEVFSRPNAAKYGSTQAAQMARLESALDIDSVAAIEGTFWGMFQIGGFNWKLCGTESPQDFAQCMSRSDHDQLLLFINFLENTNLDEPLKTHQWSKFARGYNGPSYARRGYHTRLARAYKKWSQTQ